VTKKLISHFDTQALRADLLLLLLLRAITSCMMLMIGSDFANQTSKTWPLYRIKRPVMTPERGSRDLAVCCVTFLVNQLSCHAFD
jgi:hypothetical protein